MQILNFLVFQIYQLEKFDQHKEMHVISNKFLHLLN